MKRTIVKTPLLIGLLSLFLSLSAFRQGKLTDISKPYLGEYECISANLGAKDLSKDFSYIRLELLPDGSFCLRYCDKNGKHGEEYGAYRYDGEREEITFSLRDKIEYDRTCSLKNGEIHLNFTLGKQIFSVKFRQK
ncbi:MAG: hypothetical protein IJB34_03200 [Clostridia bacterium]|nr:hypothetical protein [Clostridia bacterium]